MTNETLYETPEERRARIRRDTGLNNLAYELALIGGAKPCDPNINPARIRPSSVRCDATYSTRKGSQGRGFSSTDH